MGLCALYSLLNLSTAYSYHYLHILGLFHCKFYFTPSKVNTLGAAERMAAFRESENGVSHRCCDDHELLANERIFPYWPRSEDACQALAIWGDNTPDSRANDRAQSGYSAVGIGNEKERKPD